MVTSSSAPSFLDLVRKSGLVTQSQLDDLFGQAVPTDSNQAAGDLVKAKLLTPFQAKQLLAGKHRGFILGPYKILQPIGQGGMGVVYLGEHTTLNRKVAIKILAADQAKDKLSQDRFIREARATAALDHPNIVKLFDISQGAGIHFLVMEYVEGKDLYTLLAELGPLHYAQACEYIAQAAAGLQHAHEKGFIHRDIKPANLMVAKDGKIKILDMGLARSFIDSEDHLTAMQAEGEVTGTVDYLSPEQAVSQPLDERSDIYSLGATFYALVTGQPPFAGSTAQKLMQHQMKDPAFTRKLGGRVPQELAAIITKMMAKKPRDRYQSASDVIDALSPWLPVASTGNVVQDPITHSDLRLGSTVPKSKKRRTRRNAQVSELPTALWNRRPVQIGVGVFLLVGLIVALTWGGDKPQPIVQQPNTKPPGQTQPAQQPPTQQPTKPPAVEVQVTVPDTTEGFALLPLNGIANISSQRIPFAAAYDDYIVLPRWGLFAMSGIPFDIPAPIGDQANAIAMYCPNGRSSQFPSTLTLPIGMQAAKLHFLSGISAWGSPIPATGPTEHGSPLGSVVVTVRLIYEDGEVEETIWKNGEHFFDFNDYGAKHPKREEGILLKTRATTGVALCLTITPGRDAVIREIEFVKNTEDFTSPVIFGVTVEKPKGKPDGGKPDESKKTSIAPSRRNLISLDITRAATGVAPQTPTGGEWGRYAVDSVPFDLPDPKGGSRPNLLELVGTSPGRLSCFLPAKAIHVLCGVPGGTPAGATVGRVRLHFANGATEEIEWKSEDHTTLLQENTGGRGTRTKEFKMELPDERQLQYTQFRPLGSEVIHFIEFEPVGKGVPVLVGVTIETL
jgi:serine/threonine protein kinase